MRPWEEVMSMRKSLQCLGRYAALLLYGISTLAIQPNTDYMQHVSSAEDIVRRSWERTGAMIRGAVHTYEVEHGEKQAADGAAG